MEVEPTNKAGDMTLASQDGASEPARADWPAPPVPAPATARRWLNPTKLAYLIGPVAFAVVLVLMRFGYVERVPWWEWLTVFAAIALVNAVVDRIYVTHPSGLTLDLRVVSQVAAVTVAIYLTGWGPVLWAAYVFIALENMARAGSRVWRTTVLWSLIAMVIAQIGLAQGWLPSELSRSAAASLTVMGGFVLYIVIRMAGAVMEQNEEAMEQKEEAEAHLRLSEDRFRSLIQNTSDVTMILGEAGVFRYVSPAVKELIAVRAGGARRSPLDRLRAPRRPPHRADVPRGRVRVRQRDGGARVPHDAQRRDEPRRRSRGLGPDAPPIGGRVCRQHP